MRTNPLITVNNVGDPEPITVVTTCKRVTVGEDLSVVGHPTVEFNVRKPDKTDAARRVGAGLTYTFERSDGLFWKPLQICGYVETVSGSSEFFRDES